MALTKVQEIHELFEFDLLEIIRQANDDSFLEACKPEDVSIQKFVSDVEYWRTFYPQYNFITEKQLQHICFKYGIRAAPYWLYRGEIPCINKEHIKNFSLRNQDILCTVPPVMGKRFNPGEDSFRVSSGWLSLEEAEKPGAIFSVMGKLAFITTGNKCSLYGFFRGEGGTRCAVQYFSQSSTLPPLESDGKQVRAVLRLNTKAFNAPMNVYYSRHICPLIVAPLSDFREGMEVLGAHLVPKNEGALRIHSTPNPLRFEKYISECKERRGEFQTVQMDGSAQVSILSQQRVEATLSQLATERIKKAEQAEREAYLRQLQIDDPIVLQPVNGGYLVVTKWGKEAEIADFANPFLN